MEKRLTMEKINVGFIGAGQISELHGRGYEHNPTGRLVTLADANGRVAERRAAECGLDYWYTDYHELLADDGIDAVEILLPHHLHRQVTLDALAAGKHVSLQKPMAMSLDEADQMIAAADRSDRLFRVFENFRAYEPYMRARSMMDAGEIGEPLSIRVKTISGRGVGGWIQPDAAKAWRHEPKTGGGPPAIIDHGYHLISIVLFFMGHVEKVYAMIDTREAGTAAYTGDPAMITWKHTAGEKYGSWEITHAPDLMIRTNYYAGDEWLEVTGSRGILWVMRCSGDLLGEAPVVLHRDGTTNRYYDMETHWSDSFIRGAHEFTRSIQDGSQPDLDGREARHCLAFSLAAMQSALEHREVTVG